MSESSSVSSKPSKSLEKVNCKYCKQSLIKKNLKRHTQYHHPGKIESYSMILPGGQSTLVKSFPGIAKPKVVDTIPSEQASNPILAELEDTLERVKLHNNSDAIKSESVEVNSKDKQCIDSEKFLDPKNTSLIQELAVDIKGMFNTITEMIENLSMNKLVLGKTEIPDNSKTKTLESVDTRLLEDSNAVNDCKDAQQFLDVIQGRGFKFYEEQNLIMCDICTQSNIPDVSQRENKVGVFTFDLHKHMSDLEEDPDKQPRRFLNLKYNIISHELKSQLHLSLKEKSYLKEKENKKDQSRNEKIGINLFNLRYNGIFQGKSYLNFEDDVYTANLNGTDTGNINNGRKFAKKLTENIVSVIKAIIAQNLCKPLDATNKLRPVGMVADKITPNKRTGHIIALIIPTPENPLSQTLLTPVLLDLPPVIDHTADGLSSQMLQIFHDAGVEDSQLEGIGVDGQYIKLGVIKKLISKLDVDGYTEEELQDWIFETWDPSHNINKADEEIRLLQIFDWLVTFTNDVGDLTRTLGIGKGLEQSMQAASDLDMQLYKLQTYSSTRFAAYVEKVYKNTYNSYVIIIKALADRAESSNKKARDTAKDLLSKLLTIKFVGTLLGCIDIYRIIATASSDLQTVEQFPWEVIASLNNVINKLNKLSQTIKIVKFECNENCEIEESIEVDPNEWPYLSRHLEELKSGKFKNLALNSEAETAREVGRITRNKSDFGHEKDQITLHNRLSTLCKYQAKHIAARTVDNQDHQFPKVIFSMEGCFDIQKMITAIMEEDYDIASYGVEYLEEVLNAASYKSKEADQVKSEYSLMKRRLIDLLFNKGSPNAHILKQYEHIIYKKHTCSNRCNFSETKKCPNYMKIMEPRLIISMKVLHLLLQFPELYEDISGVLHLFLRCASKTHAESVAESMGSYVDSYSDKKRGLDIDAIGEESYIHWNGPPVHLAEEIGKASLDKTFTGRSNWRFVAKTGRKESVVVSRLKERFSKLPFFKKV